MAAGSACDVAESCTGSSADCPSDGFAAAGTVCRPAAANQLKPAGTICRSVRGPCDVAELCNGSTKACPIDVLRSTTEICKPAGANPTCDPPDYCAAVRTRCPARFAPYGAQGASCVAPMQCNGIGRCVN